MIDTKQYIVSQALIAIDADVNVIIAVKHEAMDEFIKVLMAGAIRNGVHLAVTELSATSKVLECIDPENITEAIGGEIYFTIPKNLQRKMHRANPGTNVFIHPSALHSRNTLEYFKQMLKLIESKPLVFHTY